MVVNNFIYFVDYLFNFFFFFFEYMTMCNTLLIGPSIVRYEVVLYCPLLFVIFELRTEKKAIVFLQ